MQSTTSRTEMDLDTEVEMWKPEPGDRLIGTVVVVEVRESSYADGAPYPYLEIEQDDGTVLGWNAAQSVPKRKLAQLRPQSGETLGVKYKGEVAGKNGTAYKDYVIKMAHRVVAPEVNWDAVDRGDDADDSAPF